MHIMLDLFCWLTDLCSILHILMNYFLYVLLLILVFLKYLLIATRNVKLVISYFQENEVSRMSHGYSDIYSDILAFDTLMFNGFCHFLYRDMCLCTLPF